MPSRIKSDRTHMDESVLAHCPELQSIPMNKPQLAAIAGGKIYRPQQAGYMFQNLPISKAQKESLLLDFVERSMKTKPITIPAHRYATRVTDKLSVVATSTPPHPTTPVQVASAALSVRMRGLIGSRRVPSSSTSDDAPAASPPSASPPSPLNAPDNAPDEAINTPLPTRHRGPQSALAGSSSSNPFMQAADWVRSQSPLGGSRLAMRRQPSPPGIPRGGEGRNLMSELGAFWNRHSRREPVPRIREEDESLSV
jgi:hypothetical protein